MDLLDAGLNEPHIGNDGIPDGAIATTSSKNLTAALQFAQTDDPSPDPNVPTASFAEVLRKALGRDPGKPQFGPLDTQLKVLEYIASHPKLADQIGTDIGQALQHHSEVGQPDGWGTLFDAVAYLETNPALAEYFEKKGLSGDMLLQQAAAHFISRGRFELGGLPLPGTFAAALHKVTEIAPRPTPMAPEIETDLEALNYLASFGDLADAFGTDPDAARTHYLEHGRKEGRQTTFDPTAYGLLVPNVVAHFQAKGLESEELDLALVTHFLEQGQYTLSGREKPQSFATATGDPSIEAEDPETIGREVFNNDPDDGTLKRLVDVAKSAVGNASGVASGDVRNIFQSSLDTAIGSGILDGLGPDALKKVGQAAPVIGDILAKVTSGGQVGVGDIGALILQSLGITGSRSSPASGQPAEVLPQLEEYAPPETNDPLIPGDGDAITLSEPGQTFDFGSLDTPAVSDEGFEIPDIETLPSFDLPDGLATFKPENVIGTAPIKFPEFEPPSFELDTPAVLSGAEPFIPNDDDLIGFLETDEPLPIAPAGDLPEFNQSTDWINSTDFEIHDESFAALVPPEPDEEISLSAPDVSFDIEKIDENVPVFRPQDIFENDTELELYEDDLPSLVTPAPDVEASPVTLTETDQSFSFEDLPEDLPTFNPETLLEKAADLDIFDEAIPSLRPAPDGEDFPIGLTETEQDLPFEGLPDDLSTFDPETVLADAPALGIADDAFNSLQLAPDHDVTPIDRAVEAEATLPEAANPFGPTSIASVGNDVLFSKTLVDFFNLLSSVDKDGIESIADVITDMLSESKDAQEKAAVVSDLLGAEVNSYLGGSVKDPDSRNGVAVSTLAKVYDGLDAEGRKDLVQVIRTTIDQDGTKAELFTEIADLDAPYIDQAEVETLTDALESGVGASGEQSTGTEEKSRLQAFVETNPNIPKDAIRPRDVQGLNPGAAAALNTLQIIEKPDAEIIDVAKEFASVFIAKGKGREEANADRAELVSDLLTAESDTYLGNEQDPDNRRGIAVSTLSVVYDNFNAEQRGQLVSAIQTAVVRDPDQGQLFANALELDGAHIDPAKIETLNEAIDLKSVIGPDYLQTSDANAVGLEDGTWIGISETLPDGRVNTDGDGKPVIAGQVRIETTPEGEVFAYAPSSDGTSELPYDFTDQIPQDLPTEDAKNIIRDAIYNGEFPFLFGPDGESISFREALDGLEKSRPVDTSQNILADLENTRSVGVKLADDSLVQVIVGENEGGETVVVTPLEDGTGDRLYEEISDLPDRGDYISETAYFEAVDDRIREVIQGGGFSALYDADRSAVLYSEVRDELEEIELPHIVAAQSSNPSFLDRILDPITNFLNKPLESFVHLHGLKQDGTSGVYYEADFEAPQASDLDNPSIAKVGGLFAFETRDDGSEVVGFASASIEAFPLGVPATSIKHLVSIGDTVVKDQPLAVIENAELEGELLEAETAFATSNTALRVAIRNLPRLLSEDRIALNDAVTALSGFEQTASAADIAVSNATQAVTEQDGTIAELEVQIAELSERIPALEEQLEQEVLQRERLIILEGEGALSKVDTEEFDTAVRGATANLTQAKRDLTELQIQLSTAETVLGDLASNLNDAVQGSEAAQDALIAQESTITQRRETLESQQGASGLTEEAIVQGVLDGTINPTDFPQQLLPLIGSFVEADAALKAAQIRADALILRASVDGQVAAVPNIGTNSNVFDGTGPNTLFGAPAGIPDSETQSFFTTGDDNQTFVITPQGPDVTPAVEIEGLEVSQQGREFQDGDIVQIADKHGNTGTGEVWRAVKRGPEFGKSVFVTNINFDNGMEFDITKTDILQVWAEENPQDVRKKPSSSNVVFEEPRDPTYAVNQLSTIQQESTTTVQIVQGGKEVGVLELDLSTIADGRTVEIGEGSTATARVTTNEEVSFGAITISQEDYSGGGQIAESANPKSGKLLRISLDVIPKNVTDSGSVSVGGSGEVTVSVGKPGLGEFLGSGDVSVSGTGGRSYNANTSKIEASVYIAPVGLSDPPDQDFSASNPTAQISAPVVIDIPEFQ